MDKRKNVFHHVAAFGRSPLWVFGLGLFVVFACPMRTFGQVYKDPKASVEARVADLLSRMTLEEKIGQLSMAGLRDVAQGASVAGMKDADGGAVVAGVCESPFVGMRDVARLSHEAKQQSREQSRLGIPPIQIAECLHGVLAYGATIFPQAIAQGSTWNPELIEQMAGAIAEEASAMGADQALSPLFDLIRDARYGRCEECYAEDALLAGRIGSAFVRGMQGPPEQTQRAIALGKLMCTAKHFAGYSLPRSGINLAGADVGERELRSVWLRPFEMAVREANVYSVMPSYNAVDGIPAHANRFLLTDVLRCEWGFGGYVFSDYGGVGHLYGFHHVAADRKEAALQAITAGVEIEAARPDAYPELKRLVASGELPMETIDQAVARVLTAKFKAGLFEKPYADERDIDRVVHTKEHQDLALRVAEESVILLKNDNNLLPLDRKKLRRIAVVGPNADQVQYGDYSYTRDNATGITPLQGIRQLVGKDVKVSYAKGCSLSGLERDGIDEAVGIARESDVVVAVIGETSVILSGLGWGRGPGEQEAGDAFTSGEGYDVTDINPTGRQRELLQALQATGKPIVLVVVNGRPWSLAWEKDHLPAIVQAWYPGEKGGQALAEILFGDVNPSGRLNATMPQSVGHLPVSYDYKPADHGINREPGTPERAGRDYVFSSPDPLFAFGHGLSYTTFEYTGLETSAQVFGEEGLTVAVTVKNTGRRAGKEVVQLYMRDVVSSVATPMKRLIAFDKIELQPGEERRVVFRLLLSDFALWNRDMQQVTEQGDFLLMASRSAEDIRLSTTVSYLATEEARTAAYH